jgi:hypothetical protein
MPALLLKWQCPNGPLLFNGQNRGVLAKFMDISLLLSTDLHEATAMVQQDGD